MKILLDSSIFVAGLIRQHPHWGVASPWLAASRSGQVVGIATLHALAETWRSLTNEKLEKYYGYSVANERARDLVLDLCSYVGVVILDLDHYERALERCVVKQFRSAVIYDALHLMAAERCGADAVVTLNDRDYRRLAEPGSPQIRTPLTDQP